MFFRRGAPRCRFGPPRVQDGQAPFTPARGAAYVGARARPTDYGGGGVSGYGATPSPPLAARLTCGVCGVCAWVVLVVGFGPEIGRARPCVCFGCECFLMGWVAPGACGGGRRRERRLPWIQQRWARVLGDLRRPCSASYTR